MKRWMVIIPALLYLQNLQAQVPRTLFYNGSTINMLAWNNRMQEHFSYPGMQVFIILGDSTKTIEQIFENDSLRTIPANGMEAYSCFYYLKTNSFINNHPIEHFLRQLIEFFYDQDFIDRNRIHLIWQDKWQAEILLNHTRSLDSLISSETIMQPGLTARSVWTSVIGKQTKKRFAVPGLQEMEEKTMEQSRKNQIKTYNDRKGDLFIQLTIGRHQIGEQYRTAPDTMTMVDFAKLKTLWGINMGYHFTQRFFGSIDIGIMYSGKNKKINSIDWGNGNDLTVRGSGQASAMIRYGLAIGWMPYFKERFSVLLNLGLGRLTAIAGGGTATRTIGGGWWG